MTKNESGQQVITNSDKKESPEYFSQKQEEKSFEKEIDLKDLQNFAADISAAGFPKVKGKKAQQVIGVLAYKLSTYQQEISNLAAEEVVLDQTKLTPEEKFKLEEKRKKRQEKINKIAKEVFIIAFASNLEIAKTLKFCEQNNLAKNINEFGENGLNPYAAALISGKSQQDLEQLKSIGADPKAKDSLGKSAEEIANLISNFEENHLDEPDSQNFKSRRKSLVAPKKDAKSGAEKQIQKDNSQLSAPNQSDLMNYLEEMEGEVGKPFGLQKTKSKKSFEGAAKDETSLESSEKKNPSNLALTEDEIEFLKRAQIDPSDPNSLNKALFYSVMSGNATMPMFLIKLGADVNYRENGVTVLAAAIMNGSDSIISILAYLSTPETCKIAFDSNHEFFKQFEKNIHEIKSDLLANDAMLTKVESSIEEKSKERAEGKGESKINRDTNLEEAQLINVQSDDKNNLSDILPKFENQNDLKKTSEIIATKEELTTEVKPAVKERLEEAEKEVKAEDKRLKISAENQEFVAKKIEEKAQLDDAKNNSENNSNKNFKDILSETIFSTLKTSFVNNAKPAAKEGLEEKTKERAEGKRASEANRDKTSENLKEGVQPEESLKNNKEQIATEKTNKIIATEKEVKAEDKRLKISAENQEFVVKKIEEKAQLDDAKNNSKNDSNKNFKDILSETIFSTLKTSFVNNAKPATKEGLEEKTKERAEGKGESKINRDANDELATGIKSAVKDELTAGKGSREVPKTVFSPKKIQQVFPLEAKKKSAQPPANPFCR